MMLNLLKKQTDETPAPRNLYAIAAYDAQIEAVQQTLTARNRRKGELNLDLIQAKLDEVSEAIASVDDTRRQVTALSPKAADGFRQVDEALGAIEEDLEQSRREAQTDTTGLERQLAVLKERREERRAQMKRLKSAYRLALPTNEMITFDRLSLRRGGHGLRVSEEPAALPFVEEQAFQALRAKLAAEERANAKRWANENEVTSVVRHCVYIDYGELGTTRHSLFLRALPSNRQDEVDETAGTLITYDLDARAALSVFKDLGIPGGNGLSKDAHLKVDESGNLSKRVTIGKSDLLYVM